MFTDLPPWIQLITLAAIGLASGVLINWAIYSWAMFRKRAISPWMTPLPEETRRIPWDRIPILGWPARRRDAAVYGRGFWIRPMLIEIGVMVALPWFYFWIAGGGLIGQPVELDRGLVETWFLTYAILIGLMCIGTFIDFDEQTIPDEVTVTGTVLALGIAGLAPWSRLPDYVSGGLGGPVLRSIDFASPHDLPDFHQGSWGLATGLLIFVAWIWALLPKLPVWSVGWRTSLGMMYAHAFRPKRKTSCALRVEDRTTPRITCVLVGLLVLGVSLIAAGWFWLDDENWTSLYGSLVGMAFGGLLIWSIRIIGTYALQAEAMGFGDVTLMAMIGAFLGWQATLLAFVFTMVTVVAVILFQILLTGFNALAFGPYLCVGAVILLLRWPAAWPGARVGVFSLGPILIYILIASLFLMAVMLMAIQWLKRLVGR